jgi:hypothetical protein
LIFADLKFPRQRHIELPRAWRNHIVATHIPERAKVRLCERGQVQVVGERACGFVAIRISEDLICALAANAGQ